MLNKKSNNLGVVALTKAKELQVLIDTLNNTTVGSLSDNITTNANAITGINNTLVSINNSINLINTKVSTLASIFSIMLNTDGSLLSEAYSSHTHAYLDGTINDTADATGSQTDTIRNTQGVN
jgi:hypothetical protein